MTVLLLSILASQSAEEIILKMEERAAAIRGLQLTSAVEVDRQRYDDSLYETRGEGVIEISSSGTLWNEFWSLRNGPDLRSTRLRISRHLYFKKGARYFDEDASFYSSVPPERYRVKPAPWKVDWDDPVHGDPWRSRNFTQADGGIDPLSLFALIPGLAFGTEPERKLEARDETWILECRRKRPEGLILKRVHVRKSDLALQRLEVEVENGKRRYRHLFEARAHNHVAGFPIPLHVLGTLYEGSRRIEWTYTVKRSRMDLPDRTETRFPEPLFATIGLVNDRKARLDRIVHPQDPQPLIELAFNAFPKSRWWNVRYFEKRDQRTSLLESLSLLTPESRLVREAWLSGITRPGDPRLKSAIHDAPEPVFNHAKLLLMTGKRAEAERVARLGLNEASNSGAKLLWTGLLATILGVERKSKDAARAWLDSTSSIRSPRTQALLCRHAVIRGVADRLDSETLLARIQEPQAKLLLLWVGSPEAFHSAARKTLNEPVFRPLIADAAVRRMEDLRSSPETLKALSAISDPDAQIAAAALAAASKKDPSPHCRKAVSLWEKAARFAPDRLDWGRRTLRLLGHLASLDEHDLRARVALDFARRLDKAGLGHRLGYYRWGESLGESAAWLVENGHHDRFLELALAAPAAGSRLQSRNFRARKIPLPIDLAVRHLKESRDKTEAEFWVRFFGWSLRQDVKEMARLAFDVNPDSYWVKEMWIRKGMEEGELEQAIREQERIVEAMGEGEYGGRTNNPGMGAEALAKLQIKARRFEDAVRTCREMVRDSLHLGASSLVNIGYQIGREGRPDLEKKIYLIAARFNAHMSPQTAESLAQRLARAGEEKEAYSLLVRTLLVWADHTGRRRNSLDKLESMKLRLEVDVSWEELLEPFLAKRRPALDGEEARLAQGASTHLGADSPEARDRAVAILKAIGPRAAPILAKALESQDVQVRTLARNVVEAWYAEALQ